MLENFQGVVYLLLIIIVRYRNYKLNLKHMPHYNCSLFHFEHAGVIIIL